MGRSVYSLVLSDGVIRAIDKAAYARNTSRSNLINQILADFVSYTTPEKRMRDVFEQLIQSIGLENGFQIQEQPSEAMLSLRSALNFRYNPTIRYAVELYRGDQLAVGELRVQSRTQSRQLLERLDRFFRVFERIEVHCRQQAGLPPPQSQISQGRFLRKLLSGPQPAELSEAMLGQAIAQYIQTMGRMMDRFFESEAPVSPQADPQDTAALLYQQYQQYLQSAQLLL